MNWQDIVITCASILFTVSLLPQVWHGYKEKVGPIKYQTSIPTAIGLYTIAITYYTLGLTFSTIVGVIAGSIWGVLAFQRFTYHKK